MILKIKVGAVCNKEPVDWLYVSHLFEGFMHAAIHEAFTVLVCVGQPWDREQHHGGVIST